MSRTLTSAAQAEAAKTTGAGYRIILEVDFDDSSGGPRYFSTEDLTEPVVAEGRIISMGELELSGEPQRVGGINQVTIVLQDSDYALKSLFDTQPGVQNKPAYLHLWFEGTVWADRVTLAGGVLTAPLKWSFARAEWSVTLKGFEHFHDQQIGQLATTTIFPEISCRHCENKLIPIAFGRPVYRVPACVIDRPGSGMLGAGLDPWDETLTLHTDAGQAGFTTGESINVLVGFPGRYELITGSFDDSFDDVMTITSRGSIYASGTVHPYPFAGIDGVRYFAVFLSDLPDGASAPKTGHPIYLQQQDGTWIATVITNWDIDVDRVYLFPIGDLNLGAGTNWKIGSQAGVVPIWPSGTPIEENGAWTWVANYLPSENVDRVEARASINVPGGDTQNVWLSYDASAYTVNLNNQDYNGTLGRDPTDPGLTTITTVHHPMRYGFSEETVWVTLKATAEDDFNTSAHGGVLTALTNAADIIELLLTSPVLGNLDSGTYIDSTSFAAAKAEISTVMGFALLDEKKKLLDLCSELAFQAGCLFYWDQGKAHLKKLSNTLSGSAATITADNMAGASLEIEEQSLKEWTTELTSKFRLAIPAPEQQLVRKSDTAKDAYGLKRDEIGLWAYQFPTSVASITEFWLQYRLNLTRLVMVDVYLDTGLKLQPGDVVTLDVDDGGGNAVFASKLARVRSIRHALGDARAGTMPHISLTLEVNQFTFTIDTGTPSDDGCEGSGTMDPGIPVSETRQYLRADSHRGGIYVSIPPPGRRDGGQNRGTASIPDDELVSLTPFPWILPYTPRPDPGEQDTSGGSDADTSFGCKDTLDGWGVEEYPGYAAGQEQVLMKSTDDCIRWISVDECPS